MANGNINCKDINPNEPDFRNPKSILAAILGLFKLPTSIQLPFPSPLILASKGTRPGLSPSKIASRIIQRQSEAGIPVGTLPSGKVSPSEIMERIRVEEITKAIVSEMAIDVAMQPGTVLQATGSSAGGPVQSVGTIVGVATGSALAR
jgi:hypothetical protein